MKAMEYGSSSLFPDLLTMLSSEPSADWISSHSFSDIVISIHVKFCESLSIRHQLGFSDPLTKRGSKLRSCSAAYSILLSWCAVSTFLAIPLWNSHLPWYRIKQRFRGGFPGALIPLKRPQTPCKTKTLKVWPTVCYSCTTIWQPSWRILACV